MAVKHIVLLKFKDHVSEAKIDGIFADLAALKNKIPGLQKFNGGEYSSPEGLNQGYTHGFIMTFADAKSRDAYLPHPEHEKIKDAIVPHVEAIVAFDFSA